MISVLFGLRLTPLRLELEHLDIIDINDLAVWTLGADVRKSDLNTYCN